MILRRRMNALDRLLCLILALVLHGRLLPAQDVRSDLFDAIQVQPSAERQRQKKPQLDAALSREGEIFTLSISLSLPEGGNTYSQDPSFAKPTRFEISEAVGLKPLDPAFRPDHPPKRAFDENFGKEVEKFTGQVTWSRRYQLLDGASPAQVSISGQVHFLYCKDSCIPLTESFRARLEKPAESSVSDLPPPEVEDLGAPPAIIDLDGEPSNMPDLSLPDPSSLSAADPAELSRGYRFVPTRFGKRQPLTLQFELSSIEAQAGETITLAVTMELEGEWHTFGLKPHEKQISKPTQFELTELRNLNEVGEFTSLQPPELYVPEGFDDGTTEYVHHGRVTWIKTFTAIADGPVGLDGVIAYQVCLKNCLNNNVAFSLGTGQQQEPLAGAAPVVTSYLKSTDADDGQTGGAAPLPSSPSKTVSKAADNDLLTNLIFAFLGGLILNVMPCVLPVLAIKVLSFVQQAGESRGRILALNVSYSLGVLGVFLTLASLAVFANMAWGGLFQQEGFLIAMTVLVFAMGLSLLGVYEIPIPGMIGSGGGADQKEGLTGAFMTGIFATLLATPCTGPFMGATLAWSVKQPPHVVYLIWGTMGLGMASPYLFLALFPRAIDWLPRPGMWMVRFKELSGFVLLGTVIWLLTSIDQDRLIPTLMIMLGVGFGLWWIGNAPAGASLNQKLIRASTALVVAAAVSWFAFWEGPQLPWQEFNEANLSKHIQSGKTVLVDFTADWCANCKLNEKFALNRNETISFIKEHDIVPLMADFTKQDPLIAKWLEKFQHDGVPLTVIFPAGKPTEPILLRGVYTQGQLLKELERAVAISPDRSDQQRPREETSTNDDASNTAARPSGRAALPL